MHDRATIPEQYNLAAIEFGPQEIGVHGDLAELAESGRDSFWRE